MRRRSLAQVHIANGVGKPVGRGEAFAAPVREQVASATRDALQVFQYSDSLRGQRADMVTACLHLGRRSTPHGILKIEFIPLGIGCFPGTASGQRNQPQAQRSFSG
ncbi:hypothetical protein D3C84_219950 [compost metagenome]